MQEKKQDKNLWSNCSKSQLLILNKASQLLLFITVQTVLNWEENVIQCPLFCKIPLEIITLFSTTLVQLRAVILHEDRWERETATSFYVSLSFPWIHSQGFPLRTGLYKLCVSASSSTEAAAAMDTAS